MLHCIVSTFPAHGLDDFLFVPMHSLSSTETRKRKAFLKQAKRVQKKQLVDSEEKREASMSEVVQHCQREGRRIQAIIILFFIFAQICRYINDFHFFFCIFKYKYFSFTYFKYYIDSNLLIIDIFHNIHIFIFHNIYIL